jgi:hypothetical protein
MLGFHERTGMHLGLDWFSGHFEKTLGQVLRRKKLRPKKSGAARIRCAVPETFRRLAEPPSFENDLLQLIWVDVWPTKSI